MATGDNFQVSASATLNATGITGFNAGGTTTNHSTGTANLHTHTSSGGTIDMSGAGSGVYKIFVGAGTDNVKGFTGNDTITISNAGEGDADTIDGHGGTGDVLKLSTGTHTFSNNAKLAGIETVSYTHLTLPTICSV